MVGIEPTEKLKTVDLVLDGKEMQRYAADRLGVRIATVQQMNKNVKNSPDFTIRVPEIFTNLGFLAMK
jgi:hypothetical protein